MLGYSVRKISQVAQSLCLLALIFTVSGCGILGKSGIPKSGRIPNSPVVRTAFSVLGVPYKWGGSSPAEGFDCSGLVYWVFRQHNINIPRTSTQQIKAGKSVSRHSIQAGDIVCFDTGQSQGYHVGLATGRGSFIHSPKKGSCVQESSLRNRYWWTRLLSVRRIF